MLTDDHIFPDPPTRHTLAQARHLLQEQEVTAAQLAAKIQSAEEELERIVRESRCAINGLEKERTSIERGIARTLAYLSPIRRLPHELLAHIFTFIFDDYPVCAWVLGKVCTVWRRQVLAMPKLWSKIRLVTNQSTSPDTVRLWLERSGPSVPLDIEIFLRTSSQSSTDNPTGHGRRRTSVDHLWDAPTWADWAPGSPDDHGYAGGPGGPPYMHVHHGGALHFVPAIAPHPPTPPPYGVAHDASNGGQQSRSRGGTMHWGHIAFFYLTEQMHRWERFVFRFDRQFGSIGALKSITGDAPILREFEVSCAEAALFKDWTWLPCTTAPFDHGKLETLTLNYVPFKWSSPIFRNLRSLSLRAIPASSLALDRILYLVSSNAALEHLSLHFTSVNQPVLPLVPITLENLKYLNVGGHFLLSGLVDSLSLPSLDTLIFDADTRDPIEDTITSLLARSSHPPLTKLSLAYASTNTSPTSGIFYSSGAMVTSWQFLTELEHLQTLQVGGSALEPLVHILGAPEEDNADPWFCPNLKSLSLRSCRAHVEAAAKLVQMVEARNPDNGNGQTAGGVTPAKLKHLELIDCGLESDVVKWLDGRIEDVVCVETFDVRSPRSPTFHYIA